MSEPLATYVWSRLSNRSIPLIFTKCSWKYLVSSSVMIVCFWLQHNIKGNPRLLSGPFLICAPGKFYKQAWLVLAGHSPICMHSKRPLLSSTWKRKTVFGWTALAREKKIRFAIVNDAQPGAQLQPGARCLCAPPPDPTCYSGAIARNRMLADDWPCSRPRFVISDS